MICDPGVKRLNARSMSSGHVVEGVSSNQSKYGNTGAVQHVKHVTRQTYNYSAITGILSSFRIGWPKINDPIDHQSIKRTNFLNWRSKGAWQCSVSYTDSVR